ncbi:hypothetical protein S330809_195 [Synechococcus phage S-CAM4]|uniref:Uncharacterized protein n=1 Tax=Synechococcus phage S-CAM4 TaxID=1883367 RepID=A0A1D8KL95_9CAUD|nr:hypothetical protein BOQ05_gp069 [Synechococcus phage S-CAM4]AOV59418.1 hypothetical protein C440309_195 [Synechococcus phage S-CAM4]AOV59656.1 hypothetical protein S330809_195 [Synechococcus phage S-CAM4]
MAIVFPASPSTNDTFTAGSITYKWDGAKWIGLGVTPADRLVEGSNSLEITAGNELIWTGGKVGVNQVTPIAILHAKSGANDGTLVSTFEGATNNKLNIRFDTFGPVLDVTAGDPLAFEIGGSERLRIDNSGNLNLVSSSSTLTDLNFTENQLNVYARIEGGKSGSGVGDLRFHTYSGGLAEALRITHQGEVQIANGNLKFSTAGTGIDFSADPNASGNQSEILNDYEEGVTTSTLTCGTSGTITLSNNQVSYVKVGDLVNVHGRLDVLSVSSPTGELLLELPFNAANAGTATAYLPSHSAVSLFIWNANSGAGYNQTGLWVGWISGNQNKIRIRYGSTATPGSTASNAMQAGTEVRFTATYRTA